MPSFLIAIKYNDNSVRALMSMLIKRSRTEVTFEIVGAAGSQGPHQIEPLRVIRVVNSNSNGVTMKELKSFTG